MEEIKKNLLNICIFSGTGTGTGTVCFCLNVASSINKMSEMHCADRTNQNRILNQSRSRSRSRKQNRDRKRDIEWLTDWRTEGLTDKQPNGQTHWGPNCLGLGWLISRHDWYMACIDMDTVLDFHFSWMKTTISQAASQPVSQHACVNMSVSQSVFA